MSLICWDLGSLKNCLGACNMAEKITKPQIRFSGFDDEWEQHKLGEECRITMGQSPNGTTYSEVPSDYILVQGNADLKNGWVFPRIWTTQKTKTAEVGDLIISVRAPAGSMGKTAYNVVLGRGVAAIKGNEFIYQTLVKMDDYGYWKKLAAGSTFESINSDVISNALIVIPQNIKEQEKLGVFFKNLDYLIALYQSKYDKLINIKKSMLEKMFPKDGEVVPEIRFKRFSKDWEQCKLTEFVDFFSGLTYTPNDIRKNGTLVLRSSNVCTGEIVDADNVYVRNEVVNSENVKEGDIVVVVRNGSRSLIGKHAQIKRFMPNTVIGAFMTGIRSKCPAFINILLNTSHFGDEVSRNMGATINQITGYMFSKMEFRVPSLGEQKKIGEYFENLDHLITLHQRKLEKLKNLKKAYLEKMFV